MQQFPPMVTLVGEPGNMQGSEEHKCCGEDVMRSRDPLGVSFWPNGAPLGGCHPCSVVPCAASEGVASVLRRRDQRGALVHRKYFNTHELIHLTNKRLKQFPRSFEVVVSQMTVDHVEPAHQRVALAQVEHTTVNERLHEVAKGRGFLLRRGIWYRQGSSRLFG